MPVYNSFISSPRMAGLRLGSHHSKSSRTMTAIVDVEHGEIAPAKPQQRSKSTPTSPRSSKSSLRTPGPEPALSMTIESPPLVCYGTPANSTGCLLSGLLHVGVDAPEAFASFTLTLESTITYKHPVVHSCADCRSSSTVLQTWNMLPRTTELAAGKHSYPFSYLFPGDTPATSDTSLSRISYTLTATATTTTTPSHPVVYTHPIILSRAILPAQEKHSIRVFPPTNISASFTHPSTVHPGGDFLYTLRIDGVLNRPKNTRWRLRKSSHRIEEHTQTISIPCARHASRLGSADGRGVQHEDVRTVGQEDMKKGWKNDFETADGNVQLECVARIPAHLGAACRLEGPSGIEVKHVLVVECIVAEEYMATSYARGATPTGAARVLRMQFQLCVTARSGLGISWDEESPPVYEDVPERPPGYGGPPEYEAGSVDVVTSLSNVEVENV